MNSRLYQSEACAVLCVANCRGQISRLISLASETKADVVVHMGDFAANESELSHTPSGGDASEIPLPIYVLYNNTNQLQKLAVANIYYVSNSATEIHIPAKNCTIRLYNLSNTLESTPDSLIQSLIEMFTFSSIPTSMSREIKILVTDGRASQMVSRLGTCLDVDVLLSMNVPATDLELINQTHLQIKRKYSSNRILFNRLLEPFESLLQSDYLTVEIKDMDIRVVKIESTLDRMVHSIINLGQKKLRTRQQVCTETVPLKGEEHGTRTLRTFRNPWDSDASTPNSSSPGDSFGRASAPIQGGTPAFDAADSTFWRGELDISSDMTDASEIETIGTCTVLVGNFPDETTEEELMSRFRHINILRCKIVNNKKADRRPFAFVDVKEMDRDLVLRMNGERFHGAKLKVEYDPSRLEKLGRKRADSVKLEMSHAVIEPSLPYSLKKSSSMNALEIYTAPVNPAPHSSTQFLPRPYTQSGVPGSQLFDSSNPLKKSDSWITHTGCSATNSQDAGVWQVQQHPLGSCQSQWLSGTKSSQESPTLKPKSLALKSTWDSPPRKKDSFTTGAAWDRSVGVNSKPTVMQSKEFIPPSWNRSTAALDVPSQNNWGKIVNDSRYRSSSEISNLTTDYSSFSSPDSLENGFIGRIGVTTSGSESNWSRSHSAVLDTGGWNDFNVIATAERDRGYALPGGENSGRSKDLAAKSCAIATVMSFNQQIMNSAMSGGAAGFENLQRKSSMTNMAGMNYDTGSGWASKNRGSSIGDGRLGGPYMNEGGKQHMKQTGSHSMWQPQPQHLQKPAKPLYTNNIW